MANIDKIKLSGVTYNIVDASAVHSLDGYWTSGETQSAITTATNALAETIAEQGYQTSGDVQNAISGKADTSAVTVAIDAATSGKADTTAVTEAIDAAVSGKVDTTAYTAYTAATETVLNNKADKSEIPAVSGYADAVAYNSTSKYVEFYHGGTGGTVVFSYDASPFLIDGMVQNVEIKDVTISGESVTCLVISFNTDAGKQDINIPISEIFDASNYYTKAETDNAIEAATSGINATLTAHTANTDIHVTTADKAEWSGKQDALTAGAGIDIDSTNTISITGIPLTVDDTVTSGSNNPVKSSGIYNFVTGETSTKQDTLVSGTNIKTVGTNSILGSGNIALMTAHIGTGDDSTTLIFDFA